MTSRLSFLQGQDVYFEDGATVMGFGARHRMDGRDRCRCWAVVQDSGQTQDFSSQSATVIGGSTAVTNPVAGSQLEDYYLDGVTRPPSRRRRR